jgi:hypothetical protein
MLPRLLRLRALAPLLMIAALVVTTFAAPAARVAQAADGWSSAQRITSNRQAIFPDIVIDSQGVSHVVYTETPDFNSSRIVRYMHNRGGSWSGPVTLSSAGLFADLGRLSTVTINGQVYLAAVYKARTGNNVTSRIYYRLSTDGGVTWSAEERITGQTGFEPAVTLDPSGQPHVVYSHAPSTALELAYITKVNGAWTGPVILNPSFAAFSRDTTIGYTVANGQLTLHVAFMAGANGDESSKRIYSTRKVGGGGWEPARERQSNTGGGFPKLVTDFQSRVYGTWQVNSSAYGYEPYFSKSLDNGVNWTNPRAVGSLTDVIGQTPAIARTPSGTIAVLWEDQEMTSDGRRDILGRVSTDDGENWSRVLRVSQAPGMSRNVAVSVGTGGFRAVWHDDRDGTYQLYTSTYGADVTPIGVSAIPQVAEPVTTNASQVTVNFNTVTGGPTQVRYSWDAPPTDANPWQAFAASITVPRPAGVGSLCDLRVLYTQVRNGSSIDTARMTGAIFDLSVQATVAAFNPYQWSGLPTSALGTEAEQEPGAWGGDPTYTRISQFYLDINGENDCAGLKSYTVSGGGTQQELASNSFQSKVTLPGNSQPGARTFSIALTDKLGNVINPQFTMTYDPPTPDGLPKIVDGEVAADNNTNSIIRTLTFSNLNVTDNLYGQRENLPDGKQFWGVWVANSKDNNAPDPKVEPNKWSAIEIADPTASQPKVTWSIFSGLGQGGATNQPGTYYVHVKFLDGAGNPSAETISTQVTLEEGYEVPGTFAPMIQR